MNENTYLKCEELSAVTETYYTACRHCIVSFYFRRLVLKTKRGVGGEDIIHEVLHFSVLWTMPFGRGEVGVGEGLQCKKNSYVCITTTLQNCFVLSVINVKINERKIDRNCIGYKRNKTTCVERIWVSCIDHYSSNSSIFAYVAMVKKNFLTLNWYSMFWLRWIYIVSIEIMRCE